MLALVLLTKRGHQVQRLVDADGPFDLAQGSTALELREMFAFKLPNQVGSAENQDVSGLVHGQLRCAFASQIAVCRVVATADCRLGVRMHRWDNCGAVADSDGFQKGDRIVRLIHLLRMFQAAPGGLSTRQIADRLGVSQRSVQRDIGALEVELQVPFYSANGRWAVREEYWLRPIAFSLQEAIGLLLSARLMLRHADKADAHTAAAYEKLATVLPEPLRQPLAHTASGLSAKPMTPTYSRVFGLLAAAWAVRRQANTHYQTAPEKTRRIWPRFLEPAWFGHSCYLLAWDPSARAPRVFKVERILDARVR